MSFREEILARVRDIPALPPGALDIIRLLRADDYAIEQVQRKIELDPSLTSRVLAAANSALFKGSSSITSVREAVVRLGSETVFHLAVAGAVEPLAIQPIRGYDLPGGELLKHSMGVAYGSEMLAQRVGCPCPPHTFTSGILHDLGKIILGTYLEVNAEPIRELAFAQHISFDQAEKELLGTNHAEIGAELLTAWNIPACITDVVRWHHEVDAYPGDDNLAIDLVHTANILCRMSGFGMGTEGLNYTISPASIKRLAVTNDIAEELISSIPQTLSELAQDSGGNPGS